MKQRKQKCFVQLRIAFQYTKKTNAIYKVTSPGYNEGYVGKTDRNLVTRLNEHASREDQPMYQDLSKSEHVAHIIDLLRLPDIDALTAEISNKKHFVNAVISNFYVLGTCCNWSQLLFLEALYIKNLAHNINDVFKATRELVLFRYSVDWLWMTFWTPMVVLVQWLFCEIRTNSRVDSCFIKVRQLFFMFYSKFHNYFGRITVNLN